MTFHQLVDSKTIPQVKNNVDSNTFTGITNENENINLNIDLMDDSIESSSNNLSENQLNQISILNRNDKETGSLNSSNADGKEL